MAVPVNKRQLVTNVLVRRDSAENIAKLSKTLASRIHVKMKARANRRLNQFLATYADAHQVTKVINVKLNRKQLQRQLTNQQQQLKVKLDYQGRFSLILDSTLETSSETAQNSKKQTSFEDFFVGNCKLRLLTV